jgi:hypothetical protein
MRSLYKLRLIDTDGSPGFVYLEPYAQDVEYFGPIRTHAWTLQEHLLARVLYFGDQQLGWMCRSKTYSDGGYELDLGLQYFSPEYIFIPLVPTNIYARCDMYQCCGGGVP